MYTKIDIYIPYELKEDFIQHRLQEQDSRALDSFLEYTADGFDIFPALGRAMFELWVAETLEEKISDVEPETSSDSPEPVNVVFNEDLNL